MAENDENRIHIQEPGSATIDNNTLTRLAVEPWVIAEQLQIDRARAWKLARLEYLGLRPGHRFTLDEARRIFAFERMIDAHYEVAA